MCQAKGVILFQSGFYSGGEGPVLGFGSWERPTSRAGPPRSRYCLSHFPPRRATSKSDWAEAGAKVILRHCPICVQDSIVGHGRRRKQAHDEHHDWIRIRRGLCNRCGKTFTFLPPFSPPYGHYSLIARSQALRRYFVEGRCWEDAAPRGQRSRIAWPIPPRCADGSAVWILLSRRFRVCAGRCWP